VDGVVGIVGIEPGEEDVLFVGAVVAVGVL